MGLEKLIQLQPITTYVQDAAGCILTTIRRTGAMETTESTVYDALGAWHRKLTSLTARPRPPIARTG